MDQDKTTVMGGYGSAQAGDSADATRVVPNPGYTDPAATQPSAEPTRVMDYGDTAQDSYAASSHGPYGNAAPDRLITRRRILMPPRRRIPMMTCRRIPFRSLSRRRICLARRSSLRVAGAVSRVPQVDSAIWRGRGEEAVAFVERDQEDPHCAGDLLCPLDCVRHCVGHAQQARCYNQHDGRADRGRPGGCSRAGRYPGTVLVQRQKDSQVARR